MERFQTAISCYGTMAAVVNVMFKRRGNFDHVMCGWMRETSANELLMTHRKCLDGIKTGELLCPGKSMADTYLLVMRCPV
jgi:hypothetical protein